MVDPHAAEGASTFLSDLALVLVGAGVIGVVFRRLGQPALLGYLAAGFVVGPYLPIPLFADHERVEALAEFGVVLVMLSVGLEFSIRRLGEVLPRVGVPAAIQMSTLAWLGFLLGRLLGWSELECVFLGACLAVSSTMVVARVFEEIPVPRPTRDLAFGVLVAQDLAAILAIAGLTAAVSGGGVESELLSATAGELTMFLIGLLVVGLLVVPRTIRFLVRIGNPEMLVVSVAGLAFGLALAAEEMGYSVALGAFVAGALIAESGEGHRIASLVAPVRDLFAAIFFVAVGMTVDPRAVGDVLPVGLLVVVAIVVGQLVAIGFGGTLAGRGLATSLRAGASLGQIGEFSFIIAVLGVGSGAVRPELSSIVVLAALATTFTTPIVLRGAERMAAGLDRHLPPRVRRLLTLYPSWLDELSAKAREARGRTRWRRLLAALALDVVALVGLTLLTATVHLRFAETLGRKTGIGTEWADWAILVGAIVLAIPFGVGLLRTGRRLGRELAEMALPTPEGLDLAAAPRRAMVALLEIAVVLVATSLFVTATQPVLPAEWGIVVLVTVLAGLAWAFWRTSGTLDGHVRAGAQAFAAALLRPLGDGEFEDIEGLLPGLGDLHGLVVPERCDTAGRTLAELDLRGRTGATVLAVRRGDEIHELPGADWRVEAGDLLGLTGSHEAIEAARELLLRGVEPPPTEPGGLAGAAQPMA